MTAVRCGCCGAACLIDDHWTGDQALERIVHHPSCKYVAPVRPFPSEVPA